MFIKPFDVKENATKNMCLFFQLTKLNLKLFINF